MDFTNNNHRFSYFVEGKEVARVSFPLMAESTTVIEVRGTFVNPSLRGQGIASQLIQAVVTEAQNEGYTIVPVCSYAVDWFEKHPEHQDLLDASYKK